jgi:hypothetical protein
VGNEVKIIMYLGDARKKKSPAQRRRGKTKTACFGDKLIVSDVAIVRAELLKRKKEDTGLYREPSKRPQHSRWTRPQQAWRAPAPCSCGRGGSANGESTDECENDDARSSESNDEHACCKCATQGRRASQS